MTEIKNNIDHGHQWQRHLDLFGVENHREWCVLTGLWETSIWIFDSVLIYKMMKGLNPGQRDE